jgi:hypothetical protein
MGAAPSGLVLVAVNHGCTGKVFEFTNTATDAERVLTNGLRQDWVRFVLLVDRYLAKSPRLSSVLKTTIEECSIVYPTFLDAFVASAIDMKADRVSTHTRVNPITESALAVAFRGKPIAATELYETMGETYTDAWYTANQGVVGIVMFDMACVMTATDNPDAFCEMFDASAFTDKGQLSEKATQTNQLTKALGFSTETTGVMVMAEAPDDVAKSLNGAFLSFVVWVTKDKENPLAVVGVGDVRFLEDCTEKAVAVVASVAPHPSFSTRIGAATYMFGGRKCMTFGVHWHHADSPEIYAICIAALFELANSLHCVFCNVAGDFNYANVAEATEVAKYLAPFTISVHPTDSDENPQTTTVKTRTHLQCQMTKAGVGVFAPRICDYRKGGIGHTATVVTGGMDVKTPNPEWAFDHGLVKGVVEF